MLKDHQKYFISVVGNIGVGKTTFAEVIGKKLGMKVLYEKVVDNPYLPDYYKNMDKYSFHLQIYFLKERFKEQLKVLRIQRSCIQDRSIYEDPEIFAYVLKEQGHLSKRDYDTYIDLFNQIAGYLPKPNLFVYLKANTWTLQSRIKKRGREFEMGITGEFLHQLNLAYERWINRLKKEENVLVLHTDHFDIEKDHEKLNEVIQSIKNRLGMPQDG